MKKEYKKIISEISNINNIRSNLEKWTILKTFPKIEELSTIFHWKDNKITVLEHSILVYKNAFLANENNLFLLACLLHDISKKDEFLDKDKKHSIEGAKIVKNWLIKAWFSNYDTMYITTLIKYHKHPFLAYKIINKKDNYIKIFTMYYNELYTKVINDFWINIIDDLIRFSYYDKLWGLRRTKKDLENWKNLVNSIIKNKDTNLD